MKMKSSLSFEQVKNCLKTLSWENFSISLFPEKIQLAQSRLLTEYGDPQMVYDNTTQEHIISYLKYFCVEAKIQKLTVKDIKTRMENNIPEEETISTSFSYLLDAKRRVLGEVTHSFNGDMGEYHNMLWG